MLSEYNSLDSRFGVAVFDLAGPCGSYQIEVN